jgi:hypothetical protein
MGVVTLPSLFGVNHWVVIMALIVIAGAMFAALERFEHRPGKG